MTNPRELFGDIDIYLFDQILKGRFAPGMKILDAGCGGGRNLIYFLQNGFEVYGIDQSPESIAYVRQLAQHFAPQLPLDNFRVAAVEEAVFADESFDAVLSSAVLHFARDEAQFRQMLGAMWRQLKPGGLFFARLASSIGIEHLIQKVDERRHLLPDGSERFLVDEMLLRELTAQMNGEWLEPIKTTNVENLRCMTTWVIRKRPGKTE
ncbi:MAG TPA: class I SAM-dependent methyltransferase [Blastocatellia bacterium]|nr:class I SAM-dependent methyltransferase [Blastocatellia bacterium]